MGEENRKIAVVLGGSFNPPTKAHAELLESAVEQLNADIGIFVPASENYVGRKIRRHGNKDKLYSEQERLAMLNAICETREKLCVDTCEYGDDGHGHSYNTLCKVQDKYPNHRIFFLVGADKVHELPRWHSSERLFKDFEFAVISRSDIDIEAVIEKDEVLTANRDRLRNIKACESMYGISSTEARKAIEGKDFDKLEKLMCPEVVDVVRGIEKFA